MFPGGVPHSFCRILYSSSACTLPVHAPRVPTYEAHSSPAYHFSTLGYTTMIVIHVDAYAGVSEQSQLLKVGPPSARLIP